MTSVTNTFITLFTTPVTGKPYSNLKILKYFGLIGIQRNAEKPHKQVKITKRNTVPGVKASHIVKKSLMSKKTIIT
jgi:hypothetical protein